MSLKHRVILVLVIGVVLGATVSVGNYVLASRSASANASTDRSAEQLIEVMRRVRREYVDRVDDRRLVEAAIRGMLEELDPHSRFLDSRQYEDIQISTTGNYSGVGLDVSVENGQVRVISPIDDAPAARAGILPGDVVVSVDDVAVDGDNIDETVSRMRGEPGTQVRLGVLRDGTPSELTFALIRAQIEIATVHGADLGDGYGYLRVSSFSGRTAADLESAAESLRAMSERELQGLVLDLRNNPGGILEAAVDVADLFLDGGLIVRGLGRSRHGRFAQYAAAGDGLEDVPLVVLVNGGSASAAEIVAGAIQDHHRGRLVGQRTYGKGSVQTILPLTEGSAIKLTTSHYLTPSGRSIDGTGIAPDIWVGHVDPEQQYRGPGGAVSADDDAQLAAALRLFERQSVALRDVR